MIGLLILLGLFGFAGACHLYRLWSDARARYQYEEDVERKATQLARNFMADELRRLRNSAREYKQ